MTYREIYENALRLVSESSVTGDTDDYEERAGYILANACCACLPLDTSYRLANKIAKSNASPSTYVELTESFPLCDIFSAPTVYYLAAMLVLDENESMSEKFFDLYSDALASIQRDLPAQLKSVVDRYGLM